eukprot:13812073-Alexandrium_andersonii.AAC.1
MSARGGGQRRKRKGPRSDRSAGERAWMVALQRGRRTSPLPRHRHTTAGPPETSDSSSNAAVELAAKGQGETRSSQRSTAAPGSSHSNGRCTQPGCQLQRHRSHRS